MGYPKKLCQVSVHLTEHASTCARALGQRANRAGMSARALGCVVPTRGECPRRATMHLATLGQVHTNPRHFSKTKKWLARYRAPFPVIIESLGPQYTVEKISSSSTIMSPGEPPQIQPGTRVTAKSFEKNGLKVQCCFGLFG